MESPRVLYALGKNIGEGWTPTDIRATRFGLSNHSRVTVLATGLLNRQNPADFTVFSTGHTAGDNFPSEAEAMEQHYLRIFKTTGQISPILLDDYSKDTWGNAQEASILNEGLNAKTTEIATVGFHTDRAEMLFSQEGVEPNRVHASEEVLRKKFPRFYEKYIHSELYKREERKERKALWIQSHRFGKQLLRLVALVQRHG